MNADIFALSIPLAPFLLGGFVVWTRHIRQVEKIRAEANTQTAVQYVAHTERLEERVRVLERIITDRGTNLSQEIEALRGDDIVPTAGKKLQ